MAFWKKLLTSLHSPETFYQFVLEFVQKRLTWTVGGMSCLLDWFTSISSEEVGMAVRRLYPAIGIELLCLHIVWLVKLELFPY